MTEDQRRAIEERLQGIERQQRRNNQPVTTLPQERLQRAGQEEK